MSLHITAHRNGFSPGFTEITPPTDPDTRIGFGVLKLAAGERHDSTPDCETAWLLMEGTLAVTVGNRRERLARRSLFDESPSAVHVSQGERVVFEAEAATELTVYQTENGKRFPPRIFLPQDTADEPRGKGQVGNACLRLVRTIFDGSTAPKEAKLVLGEVVTLPGRWSSYPPHHHPQPEIYHYRFSKPQGYGHAELGERVLKVRHGDTVKILAGNDHAQCAAPGYGMYYAWVIRHLPDNPYTVPEFTAEHRWTMDKDAEFWQPELARAAERS